MIFRLRIGLVHDDDIHLDNITVVGGHNSLGNTTYKVKN